MKLFPKSTYAKFEDNQYSPNSKAKVISRIAEPNISSQKQ